jgi:hypothetical protein
MSEGAWRSGVREFFSARNARIVMCARGVPLRSEREGLQ